MTNRVTFQNKLVEISTDTAHSDNQRLCDFCGIVLGGDCDEFSEFQEAGHRYFRISDNKDDTSAIICQDCAEKFSMYAERGERFYQEPVIKWRGKFGNKSGVRIEDLSRSDLIAMVRYLDSQIKIATHKRVKEPI